MWFVSPRGPQSASAGGKRRLELGLAYGARLGFVLNHKEN